MIKIILIIIGQYIERDNMGVLANIREQYAIASGNFNVLFKNVEIPHLPEAVTCLLSEFRKESPDIHQLSQIISSDVEISTKVLRTVNSALYALPNPVKSIQNAIMLLGLKSIQSITLSYTMMAAVPKPKGRLFDQDVFWMDSLLRALLARSLARHNRSNDADEAFTASLFSNLAIPVLLSIWEKYYIPVVEKWKESDMRLSRLEQKDFGWDHAQAGAWILKSWDFPDEIVGLVGSHNYSMEKIREYNLDQTVARSVALASLLPSILRPSMEANNALMETVQNEFELTSDRFAEMIHDISTEFDDIREQFDIRDMDENPVIEGLLELCDSDDGEKLC